MTDLQDGHRIDLLRGSVQYFAALEQAMQSAQKHVWMETYIFDFTASSERVAQALELAARRGLQVRLVVDGVGTDQIPELWLKRFAAAGVQLRIYNPLGSLGLLIPSRWRRLHRKLCVIDAGTPEAVGFCGGINILDDYHDPNHGSLAQPRFDFAVRITGPLVLRIYHETDLVWRRLRPLRQQFNEAVEHWRKLPALPKWFEHERVPASIDNNNSPSASSARAALVMRDNVRHRAKIEKAYLKAIGEARQEIIIANAYFLPGRKLRLALLKAARRGVRVRLLLQGKYEYFMQYHAARPVYAVLLAAGVEIHEYAASFLHAKVAVCDAYSSKAWATVGSSNLDPLSLLLAREANVVVHDQAFALALREQLVQAMESGGKQVDAKEFAQRPWHQRWLDRLAYALMRLALSITGYRY